MRTIISDGVITLRDKKSKPKRKFSFILIFSIVACVCYMVIMWTHQHIEIKERKQQLEQVSAQYDQQVEENEKLSKQIQDGVSDEELERIAREELGYVMPGEHVYADASAGK